LLRLTSNLGQCSASSNKAIVNPDEFLFGGEGVKHEWSIDAAVTYATAKVYTISIVYKVLVKLMQNMGK
jgi:hypothetical protein